MSSSEIKIKHLENGNVSPRFLEFQAPGGNPLRVGQRVKVTDGKSAVSGLIFYSDWTGLTKIDTSR